MVTRYKKCWPIKKQYVHKMCIAETGMLRWICGIQGKIGYKMKKIV